MMNIDNMQTIWANQNKPLQQAVNIDSESLNFIQSSDAKSIMQNVMLARIIEAATFFIIVCSLWLYIVENLALSAPVISAAILNLFAIVGLAANIGQIALIAQIDYAMPIKKVQQQVYKIRSHNIATAKLIILSIPLYMAYVFFGFELFFGVDIYPMMEQSMLITFAVVAVVMYLAVYWLIKQMSLEDKQQPSWAKTFCCFIAGTECLRMNDVLNSFANEQ